MVTVPRLSVGCGRCGREDISWLRRVNTLSTVSRRLVDIVVAYGAHQQLVVRPRGVRGAPILGISSALAVVLFPGAGRVQGVPHAGVFLASTQL